MFDGLAISLLVANMGEVSNCVPFFITVRHFEGLWIFYVSVRQLLILLVYDCLGNRHRDKFK